MENFTIQGITKIFRIVQDMQNTIVGELQTIVHSQMFTRSPTDRPQGLLKITFFIEHIYSTFTPNEISIIRSDHDILIGKFLKTLYIIKYRIP